MKDIKDMKRILLKLSGEALVIRLKRRDRKSVVSA